MYRMRMVDMVNTAGRADVDEVLAEIVTPEVRFAERMRITRRVRSLFPDMPGLAVFQMAESIWTFGESLPE